MTPVLLYRISKGMFFFINYLSPIFRFFISKNPTFIIFRSSPREPFILGAFIFNETATITISTIKAIKIITNAP